MGNLKNFDVVAYTATRYLAPEESALNDDITIVLKSSDGIYITADINTSWYRFSKHIESPDSVIPIEGEYLKLINNAINYRLWDECTFILTRAKIMNVVRHDEVYRKSSVSSIDRSMVFFIEDYILVNGPGFRTTDMYIVVSPMYTESSSDQQYLVNVRTINGYPQNMQFSDEYALQDNESKVFDHIPECYSDLPVGYIIDANIETFNSWDAKIKSIMFTDESVSRIMYIDTQTDKSLKLFKLSDEFMRKYHGCFS